MSESTTIAKDPKTINLIKKNEHLIGFSDHSTKTYERLPISSRRYREIEKLSSTQSIITTGIQSYFDVYKKLVYYCLKDFPLSDFDSVIWESTSDLEHEKGIFGIKNIIESCIYRAVYGIAYFRLPLRIG